MSIDLNVLATVGKFIFIFKHVVSLSRPFLFAVKLQSAGPPLCETPWIMCGYLLPPEISHRFFLPPHLFHPVLSSLKSSACRRPTRAGLRSSASSWVGMDPATFCLWRRAAVPTWRGCRPGTRSWRSRATMCQHWVPKLSSPSPRLRRTSLPVSEWCPAYSRFYSF